MRATTFIGTFLITTASAIAFTEPAEGSRLEFSFEIIDSTGTVRRSASIRVGQDGTPHVGYVSTTKLRYASRTGASWITEPVSDVYGERGCSLALDSNGRPLLTFIHAGAYSALKMDDGWSIEFLGGCNGPSVTAVTSASDGSTHACITGSCSGGIYVGSLDYSRRIAGPWNSINIETRVDNFALPTHCSIAAGDDGDPHIAVWNLFSTTLRYFHQVGTAWQWETIGNGTTSSIAVAGGVPHVAFYDPGTQVLKLGVRRPEGWVLSDIDDEGDVGRSAALAIGPEGVLNVAYYDATHAALKYARREPETGEWAVQVVDSNSDVGRAVSLDVDADGAVHIAYFDAGRGFLRYATSRRKVAVHPVSWSQAKELFGRARR